MFGSPIGCQFKAFPARTGPLGSRENVAWGLKNNFNMTSDKFMTDPAKWPEQRKMINKETKENGAGRWHTDYEDSLSACMEIVSKC